MSGTANMGPVVAALWRKLTADTELMALVSGVFDEVPEGTALPYVVLGDTIETPDNTHDKRGWETLAMIDVWSEYRGYAQGASIAARVARLLDGEPLAVTGFEHIATRYEYGQTLRDPDRPHLRHVAMRFRVITSEE